MKIYETMEEYDTLHTNNVICPYCKYEHIDCFEWGLVSGECAAVNCENCGEEFNAEKLIQITYSTKKIDKSNSA